MYVSITRARERLFLSNARYRRLFGREAPPFQGSRFIADIPDECIARPVERKKERPAWMGAMRQPTAPQPLKLSRDRGISVEYDSDYTPRHDEEGSARFRLGQKVLHKMFGEGEVRAISGSGEKLKVTVYFPEIGPKTIDANFVEAL